MTVALFQYNLITIFQEASVVCPYKDVCVRIYLCPSFLR